MKPGFLLTVLMITMIMSVSAQKPSLTLTFTANNNSQHVPLNSVLIENLTQGGDTSLYAPDTVLTINYELGIGEEQTAGGKVFTLEQNYPNPMQGNTSISLRMPEGETVLITVSDIMGREYIRREYNMDQGIHSFSFYPGRENVYFFTACEEQQSRTIKMFNSPLHASVSGICQLEYLGHQTDDEGYKSGNTLNNFTFNPGDLLKSTAFSSLGYRTIIDAPTVNQAYTFQYGIGGMPCPGMPTVTDIDGNVYNTVLMDNQCWMSENLKTTTYKNGTIIPNVMDDSVWGGLTTGAYCYYDNDINWKAIYGTLYNWYACIDVNGICPEGWHLPTYDEWMAFPPHGNELKSCRQVNTPLGGSCNTSEHPRWNEDNYNWGTNDYGFSGLPGGYRGNDGTFDRIGDYGHWWTSTENSSNNPWFCYLRNSFGIVVYFSGDKRNAFSVRCLKNSQNNPIAEFSGNPASGIAPLSVNFTNLSSNAPTSWHWDLGDGTTSTLQNLSYTYNTPGSYTVKLIATNSDGSDTEIKTDYISVSGGSSTVPCPGMPTVSDVDGNIYNTVQFGSQCWMAENLKTTTYRNGTSIPNVTDWNSWYILTTGAYVWYNNEISWKEKYGALYNWFTSVDSNGLCPTGWHVPTYDEWTELTDFIGGTGEPHANELKSCRQVNSPLGGECNTSEHPRWDTYNNNYGTDNYGFSGLPGGHRSEFGASFLGIGMYGYYWTSTEKFSSDSWSCGLDSNSGQVKVFYEDKRTGLSVRCLLD